MRHQSVKPVVLLAAIIVGVLLPAPSTRAVTPTDMTVKVTGWGEVRGVRAATRHPRGQHVDLHLSVDGALEQHLDHDSSGAVADDTSGRTAH